MDGATISWEPDLTTALERATTDRRFMLVDFSKDP